MNVIFLIIFQIVMDIIMDVVGVLDIIPVIVGVRVLDIIPVIVSVRVLDIIPVIVSVLIGVGIEIFVGVGILIFISVLNINICIIFHIKICIIIRIRIIRDSCILNASRITNPTAYLVANIHIRQRLGQNPKYRNSRAPTDRGNFIHRCIMNHCHLC
jgi:hypothetical protein